MEYTHHLGPIGGSTHPDSVGGGGGAEFFVSISGGTEAIGKRNGVRNVIALCAACIIFSVIALKHSTSLEMV